MLARKNKIRTQNEIRWTLKTKFKSFNPYFTVFLKKTKSRKPKFLISVSKKIHKQAVKRNTVRRRVEGLIYNSNLNSKNQNLNLFIVIKSPNLLTLNHVEFKKKLFKTFRFLNLKFDMPK